MVQPKQNEAAELKAMFAQAADYVRLADECDEKGAKYRKAAASIYEDAAKRLGCGVRPNGQRQLTPEYKEYLAESGVSLRTEQETIQFAKDPEAHERKKARVNAADKKRRVSASCDASTPIEIKQYESHEIDLMARSFKAHRRAADKWEQRGDDERATQQFRASVQYLAQLMDATGLSKAVDSTGASIITFLGL